MSLSSITTRANGRSPRAWRSQPIVARKKLVAAMFAAALAATLPSASAAQEYVPGESRSKARFLATFPSFVDWPDGAFTSPNAPLVFCVLGDFRFGTTLAEVSRDSMPHGHSVSVRWVRNDQQFTGCHVLFVSSSEQSHYAKVIASLKGSSTFTVGETKNFLAAGGMISISFESEVMHFEVNLSSAREANVRISSRLLALAHRVVDQAESAKS